LFEPSLGFAFAGRAPGLKRRLLEIEMSLSSFLAFGRAAPIGALLLMLPIALGAPGLASAESRIVDRIGVFKSPSRVALSQEARLYVSDTAGGIVAIYDLSGVRVGTLQGAVRPLGIAVRETSGGAPDDCVPSGKGRKCKKGSSGPASASATRVWVGDEIDGSVRVFADGEPDGFLGGGSGEFTRPNAIAVSSEAVYVVDSNVHRVAIYDFDGSQVGTFGSPGWGAGQFDFPNDIAINEAAGEVYVADFGNQRIGVFDLAGTWVRQITAPANDAGDPIFLRPSGLGIDTAGNLYVVDAALSCVVVMDAAGSLLDVVGYQNGAYWTGDFDIPIDAATDGVRVYVTSSKQHRVNVFEVSP